MRFHYRDIDRHRAELHRNKRLRVQNKASTGRKVKSYSKKGAPSAPELSNVNAKNITKIAEDMQEKIAQFNAMMLKLQETTNKPVEKYKCLFSESNDNQRAIKKQNLSNKKRKERKRNKRTKQFNARLEANKKHIKNLSNNNMTTEQINLLGRGLKFIPTPLTKQTQIRRQLLQDFDQFARRMCLQYIFQGEDNKPHPFHVKSTWVPPIQPSVALESYLEKVKLQLAEIKFTKPKNNLPPVEREALKSLERYKTINIRKADKGTVTVLMNKQDKINEAQIQLDNIEHYRPLTEPMVQETHNRVLQLINVLHDHNHIDEMTKKWLCQTPNPPRVPVFYTLTKIHKPTPVGRPIISGCDGPTEKLSALIDKLLQLIAQKQPSYLKDTTDFINFLEKIKVPKNTILVSMDVTSLYTNIPQEEGIETVCRAYDMFYNNEPPVPTRLINQALRLILQENSFQFMEGHYLQTHGTAMGTKMAVAFANIFVAKIETEILSKTKNRPIAFKRFIDDVFCLWDINREHIDQFIEQCNNHHPTIKFTAEISEQEITFLDTNVYKGLRFKTESILDVKTHFKPTEPFQYRDFTSCHPPGVKKGFNKGEALRLLRTNSSRLNFEENIAKFKRNLIERGYPEMLIQETLSEVKFENRNAALTQKPKENKRILPFVTQYQPSVPNLKQILMKNWHLIEQQPRLKEIFKEPPIISYRRGRSLKDILVRAKL